MPPFFFFEEINQYSIYSMLSLHLRKCRTFRAMNSLNLHITRKMGTERRFKMNEIFRNNRKQIDIKYLQMRAVNFSPRASDKSFKHDCSHEKHCKKIARKTHSIDSSSYAPLSQFTLFVVADRTVLYAKN